MCLIVDTDRHYKENLSYRTGGVDRLPEAFVADRPLIVKKRVRRGHKNREKFFTPYQHDTIRFGVLLKEDDMRVYSGYLKSARVDYGHHAFLYSATSRSWCDRFVLVGQNIITIYGVIPAGARYYIGRNDEVVTDQIIYYRDLKSLRAKYGISKLGTPIRGDY